MSTEKLRFTSVTNIIINMDMKRLTLVKNNSLPLKKKNIDYKIKNNLSCMERKKRNCIWH